MADMNYDGTVVADRVYTEKVLQQILNISPSQLDQRFRQGLRFYQATRQQPREIAGAEYHRFVERMATQCPENGEERA